MPIYEFACLKCGHTFETLMLKAGEEAECPECGSTELERVMSIFSAAAANTGSNSGCSSSSGFS